MGNMKLFDGHHTSSHSLGPCRGILQVWHISVRFNPGFPSLQLPHTSCGWCPFAAALAASPKVEADGEAAVAAAATPRGPAGEGTGPAGAAGAPTWAGQVGGAAADGAGETSAGMIGVPTGGWAGTPGAPA
eukprot:scaffold20169_cov90-Isochrysis_galbana.AAC.1